MTGIVAGGVIAVVGLGTEEEEEWDEGYYCLFCFCCYLDFIGR